MHDTPCSCGIRSYHNRIYVRICDQGNHEVTMFDNMNEAYVYAHKSIREGCIIRYTICDIMKDILKNELPIYLLWTIIWSPSYKIQIGIGDGLPKEVNHSYDKTKGEYVRMNQLSVLMNKVSVK